jgi:hypothetical protein
VTRHDGVVPLGVPAFCARGTATVAQVDVTIQGGAVAALFTVTTVTRRSAGWRETVIGFTGSYVVTF